jgi:hypothetical protein
MPSLLNLSNSTVLPRTGQKKMLRAHWPDQGRSPVWPLAPDFNPWANSEKNQLFYLLPSLSSLIHQHSPPSKTVNTPSPLSSTSLSPMEIWRFNQGKGSRLEAKGSSKAPLHIPLQVIWIQLEFFSPKVFKSSFCPISLHGAKIWISFGRTSSEIT